ncbi:MAG TPA: FAD-dependent oxidoreductase, partial [Kofleriaceae bacterium]|nr:FAD-dependent oxidoreductase [Kofleriaceae bacterium]
ESTDLSKVVRCDYGADLVYTELGERALDGWRRWNAAWPRARFHETGVAFLTRAPMEPGGFEHDSLALLARRGHRIERLDGDAIARRFPAYRPGALVDGYFHAEGGWAEAAATVADLVAQARAAGVDVRAGVKVTAIADDGVVTGGGLVRADEVIVCAGAWTPALVPAVSSAFRTVGQPVFHLRPADPALFDAARFPVFGADLSRTGSYGFPLTDGIVKIANHGAGVAMSPDDPRTVPAAMLADVRRFAAATFAPLDVVHAHLCVYGDTLDGHFWIDRAPGQPRVLVAAGGSGHAFKFAPLLGALIADAADGALHPRFRARTLTAVTRGDAARS